MRGLAYTTNVSTQVPKSVAEPRYRKALEAAKKQQDAAISEVLKAAGGNQALTAQQLEEQKQVRC